ncbi:MAG: hypothetical protein A2622_13465 [Bdellovibrionales bacterium RIFCSPHIGHO2_01_FULL_40_29]|nr:MAG: hypothetical protein A2622_13465 [Bdellovibrionales bacterium RIFCSPHIGHO2_01_FULL_40_29]OFZ34295.1 MAG: hypothetical protein A3D17_04485 [Bdellovibrionales bacterium RIFCSPHIGHO2_02_FULL_40_15]
MEITKWIVLRGLGRGHGHWGVFIQKMQSAFPQDKIYWLDLPGNGSLNSEKSPWVLSEYIPYLEKQLQQSDFFQVPGQTYGVGLSLGGMALVEWAVIDSNLFSKLYLINTSSANFSKPWMRFSVGQFFNGIWERLSQNLEELEKKLLLATTNLTEEKLMSDFRSAYQAVVDYSRLYPVKKINIIRQLIAASLYHFPKAMPSSVIILRGFKDRLVQSQCSQDIQQHWLCEMETHPTAGHDIAFEDSEWLIKKITSTHKK